MTQTDVGRVQSDVGRVQLKRVNAFQGLMIDADVWRDAHEYHRSQLRLHQLSLHGWGIAHGLEVSLGQDENSLTVSPGVAVDPAGNFIVVAEPYVHRLDARKPGPIYLLLQYSEVPTGPMQPPNDPYGQPTRIVEAYRIHQRDALPADPRLELCRLTFDPLAGRVKAPADPAHPKANELDTRFRIPLGAPSGADLAAGDSPGAPKLPAVLPVNTGWTIEPHVNRPQVPGAAGAGVAAVPGLNGHTVAAAAPPISLVVARHSGAGWDAHAPGLQSLARELGYAGRRLEVSEASLADVDKADVVYLTGHARLALGDAETQALGRVLERGGLVAGDGCAAGPRGDAGAREFAHSFAELAESLGLHLEAAGRAHPLFAAGRFLFAIAPPGARTSTVLLADSGGAGLVYCDADYGCAWAGGAPTQPLPRAAIRDALELGINLATLATHKSSPATH